jgi:two-component system, cell cycle response regulator
VVKTLTTTIQVPTLIEQAGLSRMDASILLIGSEDFLALVLPRIQRLLVSGTIEIAYNHHEAVPLIQAQQPDLIILQANQLGNLELCYQLKEQTKLAWIYCILLEFADCDSTQGWAEHEENYDIQIRALEGGADAYVSLCQKEERGERLNSELYARQERLLKSHILAGLRSVKNHRELVRTNDILSAIALSDPLTELNNRRALDWELPRQIQNARSRAEHLSLVMLDVDHFKQINDNYGHPVGDRALQLVSSRLRHNLRFRDTLFRYGGEEFVIILSNTDANESLVVSNRLRHLISNQLFNLEAGLDIKITISAGTATLDEQDDPRGVRLLKRADHHLLQAKANGRNQVIGESAEPALE